MPAATFCVYRGVALGPEGEVCADDVLVIWSSYASRTVQEHDPEGTAALTEVYLGFVADPELVLRAVVDPERVERARMVGYTLGAGQSPLPLTGETKLRPAPGSGDDAPGVLTIDLSKPHQFRPVGCTLMAYAGTFVGVVRFPVSAEELVESDVVPRP
jgi:hypothetical protein